MKLMRSVLLSSLVVVMLCMSLAQAQAQDLSIKPEKRNATDFMMQYMKAVGAESRVLTFKEAYEHAGLPVPEDMKPYLEVKLHTFAHREGEYGGIMVTMEKAEDLKKLIKLLNKEGRPPAAMLIQGNTIVSSEIGSEAFLEFSWAFRTGGYPKLYEAIRKGDLEAIKKLQAGGIDLKKASFAVPFDPMEPDEEGHVFISDAHFTDMNVLHLAAYFGQIKVLDYLLTQGFDLKMTCSYNVSPSEEFGTKGFYKKTPILSLALPADREEMVLHLMEKGADVNARDDGGFPVVIDIASWGNLDLLKAAIKRGADPKAIYTETGESILHMAFGGVEMLKYLVELGVDPKIRDKDGMTVLMTNGGYDVEMAKYLVKAGVDPKALDKKKQHVLFYDLNPETLAYYLSIGVDPQHKNADGKTALEVQQAGEADPEVLDKLREAMK